MAYRIVKCMECGKLFRLYAFEVYFGDHRYCRECNEKSADDTRRQDIPAIGKTIRMRLDHSWQERSTDKSSSQIPEHLLIRL